MAGDTILCGGCWLVDKTKIVGHWPDEETLAVILEESIQGGGPGMNLAVNLRRLGGKFPLAGIGVVGNDSAGRYILDRCRKYDIDSSRISIASDVQTSYTDVLTNKQNGKRTFFHFQGANTLLTPDNFADLPSGVRLLHLGSPGIHDGMDAPWGGDPNGWAYVLRKAKAAGLRTNMELISLPHDRLAELARPCLPFLDTMIINDLEVGALAGEVTASQGQTDVGAVKRAACKVLTLGVRELVAVHFPRGCVVAVKGEEPVVCPSVKVPKEAILCSVGAGDAFASGFLFGFLEGLSIHECIRLAHAAAGVCLCSLSTNEAIGTAAECMAHADAWGWRKSI